MSRLLEWSLCGVCVAALSGSEAAFAGGLVVDDVQSAVNYGFWVTSPNVQPDYPSRWQEFVPSYSNIEEMDFFIYDQHRVDSILNVSLMDSKGGLLWSAHLADVQLPGYGWLRIDTPRINVVAGQSYRVHLSVDKLPNDGNPSMSVFWLGSTAPTTYFNNDVSDAWPTYSYAFQTLAAVPEPGSAAAMLLGLLALAGFVSRFRA